MMHQQQNKLRLLCTSHCHQAGVREARAREAFAGLEQLRKREAALERQVVELGDTREAIIHLEVCVVGRRK